MVMLGTRHPFLGKYTIAVDTKTLKIRAVEMDLYANCGHSLDLSIGVVRMFNKTCTHSSH
jgi:xanthine dehydrogenase molybdopterin-binding subunit B